MTVTAGRFLFGNDPPFFFSRDGCDNPARLKTIFLFKSLKILRSDFLFGTAG
ncbi:hypothetical protein [Azospirillum argentinense]